MYMYINYDNVHVVRCHYEQLIKYVTFLSFWPKLSPGESFSTIKHEMPPGPVQITHCKCHMIDHMIRVNLVLQF